MSRIVIPSSTDWLQSADFNSGTVFVEGRLAEMLHPHLWRDTIAAYAHALDPRPWDYSGRGRHATRNNGVRDHPAGGWQFSQAAGAWIALPLTSAFAAGDPDTFSCWLRSSYAGTTDMYVFIADPETSGSTGDRPIRYLRWDNGVELEYFSSQTSANMSWTDTTAPMDDGKWHHLVIAYDGVDTLRWYIDGVLRDSVTQADAFAHGPFARYSLGGLNGDLSGRFWEGEIDDVIFHRRQLSAEEIQLLASRRHPAYECRLLPKVFAF